MDNTTTDSPKTCVMLSAGGSSVVLYTDVVRTWAVPSNFSEYWISSLGRYTPLCTSWLSSHLLHTPTPFSLVAYPNTLLPCCIPQHPSPLLHTPTPFSLVAYPNTPLPCCIPQHPSHLLHTPTPFSLVAYPNTPLTCCIPQHLLPCCIPQHPSHLLHTPKSLSLVVHAWHLSHLFHTWTPLSLMYSLIPLTCVLHDTPHHLCIPTDTLWLVVYPLTPSSFLSYMHEGRTIWDTEGLPFIRDFLEWILWNALNAMQTPTILSTRSIICPVTNTQQNISITAFE